VVIANAGDNNIRRILESVRPDIKVIWYGEGSSYSELPFKLSIIGDHNQLNAESVLALADYLKIDRNICQKVFASFKGAKRRMEYYGEYNEALLYDDYGHHPTEIAATINAIKKHYPDKLLCVVFWPHQYKEYYLT